MQRRTETVRNVLSRIEWESGKRISYAVGPVGDRIGRVQVNVYPTVGDAKFRIFDLHDGVTAVMRQAIREWFEPFALTP